MIKRLKCWCKNLSAAVIYNISVINYIDLFIKFILQYNVDDKTITKNCDIKKGEKKGFFLPKKSCNVCLNILDCSLYTTRLIHHECVEERRNICYQIQGIPKHPTCIKKFAKIKIVY
ncbi:hypothetical protein [Clostridium sp. K25]|uniref:hypothetical protein n=1 Tax=Clostridium sp. K25 TaxID=1443109 RepID=UPI0004D59286|nr:hypothetical protein [Clostridium sp. K25]KEI06236.1 hypothetical protein Z957_p0005 [Clostridium sp. K25]